MKIIITIILLTTGIFFSDSAFGQELSELRDRAKQAVEEKRPDLELRFKSEEGKQIVYSWGAVQKGIGLLIFYGDSQKDAASRMKLTNKIISVDIGRKLTGFGDEAYFSENPKGDYARLRFRKSHVYVEIGAPTLALAEEITRDLDKFIKKRK